MEQENIGGQAGDQMMIASVVRRVAGVSGGWQEFQEVGSSFRRLAVVSGGWQEFSGGVQELSLGWNEFSGG